MTQALLFAPTDTAITEVNDSEFHPTRERAVVEALILGMREAGHEPLPFYGTVREAAAGEGALVEHVEALVPSTTRSWRLYELKRELARCCSMRTGHGLVVSDFLALSAAREVATLETPKRSRWLREHMPDVYPLEWRPDYDGRGGFDRPVAWFCWGPGRGGRWWPLRHPEDQ